MLQNIRSPSQKNQEDLLADFTKTKTVLVLIFNYLHNLYPW